MTRAFILCAALAAAGCAGADAPSRGTPDAEPDVAPAAAAMVLEDLDGTSHDVDKALAGGKNVVLAFWQVW